MEDGRMTDVLPACYWRRPDGLVFAYIVVIAMGGVLYVAMSMFTRSSPLRLHWLCVGLVGLRRCARAGIAHRRDRVGVGYTSATRAVHLSLRELAGPCAIRRSWPSGKTTFLQLLVEASVGAARRHCRPERQPCAGRHGARARRTGVDTGWTSASRSARPAAVAGAQPVARGGGLQR